MSRCTPWLLAPLLMVIWCDAAVISPRRQRRAIDTFQWRACDEGNATFLLHRLEITPTPMELPGTISVNMTGEATREVENLEMDVEITKINTFFGDFRIPCLLGMGSCSYRDLCGILERDDEFINQTKELLLAGGAPLSCPVQPQTMAVENFAFQMPPIPTGLGLAIEGEYRIKIQMIESDSGEMLGCFEMEAGIIEAPEEEEEEPEVEEDECTSWWCW